MRTVATPVPPKGYRLLVDGVDLNSADDLAWMMAPDDWVYEWVEAVGGFFENPRFRHGNGKVYCAPPSDPCHAIYRCRKV